MIIFSFLGTIYFYITQAILFAIATPIAFLIWLISTPFDRERKLNHRISCTVGQFILLLNPYWNTKASGMDKLDKKKTYVLTSNHQSLADIVMLTYLRPLQFKYVSKKEINYIPFLGWIMSMSKYVLLNRKDPKSQFKMMRTCEKHLNNNISIAIFPEGTRTKTGELGRFKDGASLLAKNTNTMILPICMVGNQNSMPRKGFMWDKRVPLKMFILDPIDPKSYEKTKDLTNAVKEAINNKLQEEMA